MENKSIPLISIESSSNGEYNLELTSESIDYLSSIKDKKLSIISIIGPAQTEKSKFADSLFNDYTIFNWKKQTKGINIYSKYFENSNCNLMIFDTEGLYKLSNIKTRIDNNIFITCLLISSTMIYNTIETPENAIKNFSKLAKESLLKIKNNREENNNISIDNIPKISFIFHNISGNINEQIKKINELISSNELFQNTFKKYSVNIIPKNPKSDNYSSTLITDIKKNFVNKLIPKKINGINLNGDFVFGLIQIFIDCLNRDEIIYLDEQMSDVISLYLTDIVEKINCEINKNEIHEKLLLIENNFFENIKENFSSLTESQLEKFRYYPIIKEIKSIEIITPFESIIDKVVEVFEEEILNIKNDYLTNLKEHINKEINIPKVNQNNIVQILSNLNSYLKTTINIILENKLIGDEQKNVIKNIYEKINKHINKISDDFNKIILDLVNKNKQLIKTNEQQQKEFLDMINKKEEEINKLKINIDTQKMNFKDKELELNNLISIEKLKYNELEKLLKKNEQEIIEKEKKIDELNLTNKLSNSFNYKIELSDINDFLIKYKEIVNKLKNNQNLVIKTILEEKTILEMEKKYSYSLNLLSEKDSLDKLNKYYEKQKEKLNQEKQNLNETIDNQRKEIEELKDNIEVLNMKLEEKTNEYDYKCSQWSNNLQTISFLQNNIKEQDKKIEKLNINNYQYIVKIQTFQNERENLINIIKCILKKQSKESMNVYIVKLSEKMKKQIEEILK